jgi:hypothetical protein
MAGSSILTAGLRLTLVYYSIRDGDRTRGGPREAHGAHGLGHTVHTRTLEKHGVDTARSFRDELLYGSAAVSVSPWSPDGGGGPLRLRRGAREGEAGALRPPDSSGFSPLRNGGGS